MKKPTSPDPKATIEEYRASIVEKFGPLDSEVSLLRPKLKEHEKLSKEIQSWYEDAPSDATFTIPGSAFTVLVSERKNQRTILSMPALYKALKLKLDVFLDKCKMNLDVIDALLPAEKQEGIVSEERTGNRSVKVIQSR